MIAFAAANSKSLSLLARSGSDRCEISFLNNQFPQLRRRVLETKIAAQAFVQSEDLSKTSDFDVV